MEDGDDYSMEMAVVATNSSDDEYSVEMIEQTGSDLDSEYGEQTLTPRTVTKNSSVANNDFYHKSVRRQNCCFGASMLTFVGAFVAAYFLMGVSFSPSNIGIFGDESSMKGGSGEVGLDAANAETQEIVDEEVIELEEAGNWGNHGRTKAGKRDSKTKDRIKELIGHNKVGKNNWVENKDWWQKHAPDMDTSNMTKKEMRTYAQEKKKEKRKKKRHKKECKLNPESMGCKGNSDTDLDSIREKLAEHYNYESTGAVKENFPAVDDGPDREGGGKKKHKNKNKQKNDNNVDENGSDEEEKDEVVTEEPLFGGQNEDKTEANEPDDEEEDAIKEERVATTTMPETTTTPATTTTTTPATTTMPATTTTLATTTTTTQATTTMPATTTTPTTTTTTLATTTTTATTTTLGTTTTTTPATTTTTTTPVEETIQSTIVDNFTVLKQVTHDQNSFTQGLSYGDDGMIYETSGLYRQSKVRRIDPDTFEVEQTINIEDRFFGEGCTFYRDADGNGRLIEITWMDQIGFIYDSETLKQLSDFKYTTTPGSGNQGWGITYDASKQEFIVSDGSKFLYFWDRDTLKEKRKVTVTRFDGSEQNQLNELEWMDGLVCCNIWHRDDIICVDPTTGKSVREYDMSSLWPANQRGGGENVLNGIALGKDHVLLTGKRWDRMYKVVFPNWPTLFNN